MFTIKSLFENTNLNTEIEAPPKNIVLPGVLAFNTHWFHQ